MSEAVLRISYDTVQAQADIEEVTALAVNLNKGVEQLDREIAEADIRAKKFDRDANEAMRRQLMNARKVAGGISLLIQVMGGSISAMIALTIEAALLSAETILNVIETSATTTLGASLIIHAPAIAQLTLLFIRINQLRQHKRDAAARTALIQTTLSYWTSY